VNIADPWPWATAFVAACQTEVRADDMFALDQRLRELLRVARAAWPELELPDLLFIRHIAERTDVACDWQQSLDVVEVADLYLACACCHGDERAVVAMEQHHAPRLERTLARIKGRTLTTPDLHQIVRHKLYVGEDGKGPALIRYSGQGPLSAWLRVTAVRAALNAVRARGVDETGLDDAERRGELPACVLDPELQYLRDKHREDFKIAFERAVSSLEDRDRTVLRLTLVNGLNVRDIGRVFSIHHATAARWIANAKQRLAKTTREILKHKLDISGGELDSIIRLVDSELEVSVARLLESR